MSYRKPYSPEVRERVVRMALGTRDDYPIQWAAIRSIADKIGCSGEVLRNWVRQAEADTGIRPGLTSDERAQGPADRLDPETGQILVHLRRPQDARARSPTDPDAAGPMASRAREEGWDYQQFLAAALAEDVTARESHDGVARVKAARFHQIKPLDDFPFAFQRSIDRTTISQWTGSCTTPKSSCCEGTATATRTRARTCSEPTRPDDGSEFDDRQPIGSPTAAVSRRRSQKPLPALDS